MPIDTSKIITGQVVLRHNGPTKDGRTLVVMVGIIAVPDDLLEKLPTEHQFTLFSRPKSVLEDLYGFPMGTINQPDVIDLVLSTKGRDVSEDSVGDGLGGLLTKPIWRY